MSLGNYALDLPLMQHTLVQYSTIPALCFQSGMNKGIKIPNTTKVEKI